MSTFSNKHVQIPTGTIESKRTTVPFLYNLDEKVEGLNVVDFPGVDDEDDSIGDLADLLVTVAQIIVFVVDYRYIFRSRSIAGLNSDLSQFACHAVIKLWLPSFQFMMSHITFKSKL